MRKLFTVWNTSSRPSALTRSKILLSAMNVPVRPAPALQHTQTQKLLEILSSMNSGLQMQTALSSHAQNSVDNANMAATCSVRRWDGSQTAAAVSALRR